MSGTKPNSGNGVFAQHWYEKLMEVSPVGIFFTDAEGNCLHVNQRWCEIAGMGREEALGRGWVRAIHKEDLDHVARLWYESAAQNVPFHAQYRSQTPAGITTWVVGDARAILVEDGTIEGYIGTITDIHQAKQDYDELQQYSERIRTIIQQMPVILFAFDDQGRMAAWNAEAERVTGYAAEELIGNRMAMELLCPDPVYRQEMLEEYMRIRDNYLSWEWRLTAKDGSEKIIAFSNISQDYPVNGWANWGVGVDVTDSRSTEYALRERVKELSCLYKLSLLSNRPNLDLDAFMQEAVELIPSSLQYPEITCARIIYEDRFFKTEPFIASSWKLISQLNVRGRKVGQIEVYYTREKPQEAEGPFIIEERLLIDEIALQISRTIGHVLARKDLAILDEISAKADELERFSHVVSHDLRTPLTAISGYAQLLSKQVNQNKLAEAKSCAQRVIDITDHMEHRLNELLKLAKLGKVIDPKEVISFSEILDETLDMMAGRLEDTNVSVKIESDFPQVMGDRTRLQEVIENLLDNAIKYIGDPPNRITVGCRNDGEEKVLYIKDNGIGIPPEHVDDVFQLFWRLDKTSKGDGTGLAIVKRIIEEHGGRIWVETDGENQGACFCFTFGQLIS